MIRNVKFLRSKRSTKNSLLSEQAFSQRQRYLFEQYHKNPPKFNNDSGGFIGAAADVMAHVLTNPCPKFRSDSSLPSQGKETRSEIEVLGDYYLNACTNLGAYTDTFGVREIRENLALFLTARDGVETSFENIRITGDPIEDLKQICLMLVHEPKNAFFLPPNDSSPIIAAMAELSANTFFYPSFQKAETQKVPHLSFENFTMKKTGMRPVALYMDNPNYFKHDQGYERHINNILELCFKKQMLVISNESDFSILSPNQKFTSIKAAIKNHPNKELADNLESITLCCLPNHVVPEWTHNGGFIEFSNIDPFAMEQITKLMSMRLAGDTASSIAMDLLFNLKDKKNMVSTQTIEAVREVETKNLEELMNNTKKLAEGLSQNPEFQVYELREAGSLEVVCQQELKTLFPKKRNLFEYLNERVSAAVKDSLGENKSFSIDKMGRFKKKWTFRVWIKN